MANDQPPAAMQMKVINLLYQAGPVALCLKIQQW